jgi:hypothetical protein
MRMTLQIELRGLEQDPGWQMDPAALALFCSAASVTFQGFHRSPEPGTVAHGATLHGASFAWDVADLRTQATHRNSDDATRDGAYAVAFAALRRLGPYVFIHRALRKSGADFVLAREGALDGPFIKLEVSGIGKGTDATVARRLREKDKQVTRTASEEQGLAVVVRFARPHVAVEEVAVGLP